MLCWHVQVGWHGLVDAVGHHSGTDGAQGARGLPWGGFYLALFQQETVCAEAQV